MIATTVAKKKSTSAGTMIAKSRGSHGGCALRTNDRLTRIERVPQYDVRWKSSQPPVANEITITEGFPL